MEYKTKTIIYSDGSTVRVHKPILTEEERARRQAELYKAAERFLKQSIKKENYEQRAEKCIKGSIKNY
nr:MAG TPA: Mitochondrial ribosomal protein L55 [Caudoviricetes sp.]